jgi:outer membrane protein OmpA-like peptidoglycan-associated protein
MNTADICSMKRSCIIQIVFVLVSCVCVSAQDISLSYRGSGGYSLVERTDLRRYENKKYVGLTSREVRSFISPAETPALLPAGVAAGSNWYDGSFYVQEQTLRNAAATAAGIHDSVAAVFSIAPDGQLSMVTDNGYPSFRSFPAFPDHTVHSGDRWQHMAERAVDPAYKGRFTRIPMYIGYEFVGEEVYRNEPVYRIKALWQTNYNERNRDPQGDPALIRAAGGHKADILIRKQTGSMILVSDLVDEEYQYADGLVIDFRGTITLFTEIPPVIDHEKLAPSLNRLTAAAQTAPADPQNVIVEKTPAGMRLSMRNIRFQPDSAIIVPEERGRLDEIAAVLARVPGSQFLIEGHTASVGKSQGEQTLSEQRAHSIAEELVKRGIPAQSCICRGWGGTRPVASNDTEDGRTQNRRVEITILE